MKVTATTEECEACGDVYEIETKAKPNPAYDWTAYDGDEATCMGCGARGMVSVDASGSPDEAYAYVVAFDEEIIESKVS